MAEFDLQGFLPFRLSRLAHEVSNRMADVYSERFDLGIPEWRILATLAEKEKCTAQAIVASTRTHKSTISRAVARLIKNDWIERVSSKDDKRMQMLRLSSAGHAKFAKLAPLVVEFESSLYSQMSDKSIKNLLEGIDELEGALDLGIENRQKKLNL